MKKNLTLNQAVAEYFGIDGRKLPEFNASQPVDQARAYLKSEHDVDTEYTSFEANDGIVVYSQGGMPIFAVADGDADELRGVTIHGTLSKVAKKAEKTQKTVKTDESE